MTKIELADKILKTAKTCNDKYLPFEPTEEELEEKEKAPKG